MKIQISVNDAILAVSILVIFYVILYFSIPKLFFEEEKYLKFLSYDILFAIDRIYRVREDYDNLRGVIRNILINFNLTPVFFISDFGLWKKEINISCICEEEIILLLNNIYRNIEVNGRNISINFFPTKFPLTTSDFERHGLIIFGCNEEISNYYSEILRYSYYNGILFVCDINQSYYNRHSLVLSNIFNLTLATNNANLNAVLIKPAYGYLPSYKAFKILKYQYGILENSRSNLLTNEIVVKPMDVNMYLFRQENSEVAAVTLTSLNRNIIGWCANFYRDRTLDINERRVLLSLILSITSYKEPIIEERVRKNLIPYVSYHYTNFLEPFILYFSLYT